MDAISSHGTDADDRGRTRTLIVEGPAAEDAPHGTASAATAQPLSVLMREGSQIEHHEAENSSFITELMSGRVNEHGYADFLVRYAQVYAALESTGRSLTGDPIASAVIDPALERGAALEKDMAYWGRYASSSRNESPATDAYVARIEQAASWGGLYLAHHYTRYLGDLSGGQAIGRIMARTFGLKDGEGLAFYHFAHIPKPKKYKDAYRARLDALPLDRDEKQRVLTEVKATFSLNGAIFAEMNENLDAYRR